MDSGSESDDPDLEEQLSLLSSPAGNSDGDSMGLVSKSDHPSLEQDLSPLDPAAELAVLESMEWGPQSDDDDSGRPEIEDGEAGAGHMVSSSDLSQHQISNASVDSRGSSSSRSSQLEADGLPCSDAHAAIPLADSDFFGSELKDGARATQQHPDSPGVLPQGQAGSSADVWSTAGKQEARKAFQGQAGVPSHAPKWDGDSLLTADEDAAGADGEDNDGGADSEAEDESVVDEEEVEAAIAASMSWSRVVRKPRTRHWHVILDVCAAKRTAAGHVSGEGQLLQQVVGKADIAWAGAKGYRIARKARWGDLWPTFFQDRAIVVTQKQPAKSR